MCSLKTALVVGTVLAVINHGPAHLAGRLMAEQQVPLALSYFVPFTVATSGQIQGNCQ